MQALVLDTNVVLDLLVFADEAARPVMQGLEQGRLRWLATAAMREELARVLGYPKIAQRMAFHGRAPQGVLQRFDAQARQVETPLRAPVVCKDPDDQKFIDLAVAHGGLLLSKDAQVLRLRKRLAALSVWTGPALPAS
jgi:putative PIN family toxin of toxin-antitoxin system